MRTFGEIAERLRRCTAQIFVKDQSGGGSGVVWSADGLILTNAHVARVYALRVQLWDGSGFDARIVARDSRSDLAALRVPAQGLEFATPGDSTALRAGELVMAVGSPFGFAGALSAGVIHSIGPVPGMGGQRWIRADIRVAPGNSGGPLANAEGRVIGINTAIVNGVCVAAPVSSVIEFVERGPRPALGVTLRTVPFGLLIMELESGGAADLASLRVGDIVLARLEELSDLLDSGQEVVRLRFLRGNLRQVREVAVHLTTRVEAA